MANKGLTSSHSQLQLPNAQIILNYVNNYSCHLDMVYMSHVEGIPAFPKKYKPLKSVMLVYIKASEFIYIV